MKYTAVIKQICDRIIQIKSCFQSYSFIFFSQIEIFINPNLPKEALFDGEQSFVECFSIMEVNAYSAFSNLSLNIHGHVEVPKTKSFEKIMSVSCNEPLNVEI